MNNTAAIAKAAEWCGLQPPNTALVMDKRPETFAEAQALADAAMKQHPGRVFLPYDYGESVWPRYGIMEPPAVGDDVSMGFNGDYYYVGKVEKIGKNYRQIKAGGKWFYRRKLRPAWREAKSPFALVNGIRNELNPSF